MTHTPPIPAGNQSPYPLAEPKHQHVEPPATAHRKPDAAIADRARQLPLVAIGAAVGLGVALIGGALLGLRRGGGKTRDKRGRRKAK